MEKILSKEDQLNLLIQPDAVKLMKNCAALAGNYRDVAWCVSCSANPEEHSFLLGVISPLKDEQSLKLMEIMPLEEAERIIDNGGHIYEETFLKMLDVFPLSDAKAVLLTYAKDGIVWDHTMLKIIPRLQKEEVKELVIANKALPFSVLCELLKIFSVTEVKDLIVKLAENEAYICDEELVEILNIFSKDEQKEVLNVIITKSAGLGEDAILKLFLHYPPEEMEEIIRLCIENDTYMGDELLRKIISTFPSDTASSLLEEYFAGNCGVNYFDEQEQDYYRELIP